MKATNAQLAEALKAVGLQDVELVESEADADFDLDGFISAIDSNRESILKPRLTEELTGQIQSAIGAKAGHGLRKALRDITGMDKKALDAIPADADAIKAAVEYVRGSANATQDDIQAKIDEMIAQHNQEIEAKNSEWEQKYNTLNSKYIDRDVSAWYRAQLKDAPLPKDADKETLADDFKRYMADKYHNAWNEEQKAVGLFTKENPNMPALNGSKHVDIMEEAKGYFSKRGQWVTDMRNATPTGVPPTPAMPSLATPANKALGTDAAYNPSGLVEQINQLAPKTNNAVA